ncbi:MAG: cation transporter [Deltaproteobacteria bacterium]|nr:cation transporter [Deltaproteobacteria bacterium]
MAEMKEQGSTARDVRRVTLWGAVVNVLLAVLKIVGGKLSGSIALVADGVHSLSDLLTDLVVVVGVSLGARPPDDSHPYGHGRFETLAAIIVALSLVGVGIYLAWEASSSMLVHHQKSYPGQVMVILALVSIAAKEAIYRVTRRVARRTKSPAVLANAWHHRSDALSSVAVLLGGAAGMLGFPHGDHVAGIVVGLMVVIAGGKIALDEVSEILEKGVDEAMLAGIQAVLDRHPEVKSWHKLRTRKLGREVFADVHVLVEPDLSVRQGHAIADEVEAELRTATKDPINISIHIEPFDEDGGDQSLPPSVGRAGRSSR